MKKCPHCGQSVRVKGSTCPLCQQDMGDPSSLPQSTDTAGNAGAPRLSPEGLAALERLWAEKSDEALEEAAHELEDYTEEGQRVIHAELQRRAIPVPEPGSEEEEERGDPGAVRVHSDSLLVNVTMVKDALQAHGIACQIRGASLSVASGGIPSTEAWPELWGLDASRVEESRQLVSVALAPAEPDRPDWTCPKCHETLDGHFSTCWNCGFSDAALPPSPDF